MVLFTTEYKNISLITPIGVFLYNFVCCSFCRFLTRFLPVFSTVLAKILFAMAKTQPCAFWTTIVLSCMYTHISSSYRSIMAFVQVQNVFLFFLSMASMSQSSLLCIFASLIITHCYQQLAYVLIFCHLVILHSFWSHP